MQKIITCLGFDNQAGEAINFYTSIDPELEDPDNQTGAGDGLPIPKGSLLAATFQA